MSRKPQLFVFWLLKITGAFCQNAVFQDLDTQGLKSVVNLHLELKFQILTLQNASHIPSFVSLSLKIAILKSVHKFFAPNFESIVTSFDLIAWVILFVHT